MAYVTKSYHGSLETTCYVYDIPRIDNACTRTTSSALGEPLADEVPRDTEGDVASECIAVSHLLRASAALYLYVPGTLGSAPIAGTLVGNAHAAYVVAAAGGISTPALSVWC